MFVLSEKIAPPRRRQIFNDYLAEDTAMKKREEAEGWIKRVIEVLNRVVRSRGS